MPKEPLKAEKKLKMYQGKIHGPQVCDFIKNETLAKVFSCDFCEISKNTSLYRTRLAAASRCSITQWPTMVIGELKLR